MFQTIKNAFKTPDVRKRLGYTLLLIVLFRLGCFITVPGVDTFALAETMKSSTMSLTSLIDTISGGAFSNLSIFAMSITPYITASIVIQLLGMIIPSLEKLMKEGGETSRAKVNRYTKLTAMILALVEALRNLYFVSFFQYIQRFRIFNRSCYCCFFDYRNLYFDVAWRTNHE